jgi:hypothetical protein
MNVTDIAITGSLVYIIKNGHIYRSTNCGFTWPTSYLPMPSAFAYPALNISIAPDDPNFIAVTDSHVAGDKVWISLNGGTTWQDAGKPECGIYVRVTDISVTSILNGERKIFVSIADTRAGNTQKGDLRMISIGGVVPAWQSVYNLTGTRDFMAVRASPNYASDMTVCAVSVRNTIGVEYRTFNLNIPSVNQTVLLIPAGVTNDYGNQPDSIMWADIALPATYYAGDPATMTAFVSIATKTLKPNDGVYRVYDQSQNPAYLPIPAAGSPALGIRSIDYSEDQNGVLLVAGEHTTNRVWHSHNPLNNTVNWTLAASQPTGQNEVVVEVSPGCHKVFAGTTGGNNCGISAAGIDPLNFGFLFGC